MATTRKKVLLVDDFPTQRQLIADFLDDNGYDVKALAAPEEIGDELNDFGIVVMDVHFGNDRPFDGIDYVIEQIRTGTIDPADKTIIFKTMWNKEMLPERLQSIEKYEFWDCSEGLEFTELRTILRRNTT